MVVTVLSFLVGVALGASILYWVSQNTIGAQRKQLEQNHRLMGDLEQSHETRMRDTIESIQRKHQKELEEQRQPLDNQIEDLTRKHQDSLNDLAQDHWNTLEAFQTERYLEITNLKKEHQEQIASLNAETISLKQKFQADMKAIQQQFQKKLESEVESARSQFQVVVDKFINDHKTEIDQLKQDHRQEMEQLAAQMNGSIPASSDAPELAGEPSALNDDPESHLEEVQSELASAAPEVAFEAPPATVPDVHEDGTEDTPSTVAGAISPTPDPFLSTIEMLGRSKRVSAIGQLSKQVAQANPEGRQAIAVAFSQILAANPQSPAVQKAIAPLSKLSQDRKPTVRQAAIEALGHIPSSKAVPIVKRALRDPDAKVLKVANQAMEKLRPFAKSR